MKGYDAIVVGSGVIGLSCAWRLSEQGRRVVVFDPTPGNGASAVGAGMLAPVTEATWHDTTLVELNIRAAKEWPAFAVELETKTGRSTGFRACGTVHAAFDASDKAALEEIVEFEASLGLDATWCAPTRLRALEPLLTPGVRGGIWAPGEHQVDNRLLFTALEQAALACGVRCIEGSIDAIVVEAEGVRGVRQGEEVVSAPLVVLAAGHAVGRIGGLPPGVVPEIRPVKGQILRLVTRDRVRFTNVNVRGLVNGTPVYVASRDDGGVVVGATQEEKGEDVSVDAGGAAPPSARRAARTPRCRRTGVRGVRGRTSSRRARSFAGHRCDDNRRTRSRARALPQWDPARRCDRTGDHRAFRQRIAAAVVRAIRA